MLEYLSAALVSLLSLEVLIAFLVGVIGSLLSIRRFLKV